MEEIPGSVADQAAECSAGCGSKFGFYFGLCECSEQETLSGGCWFGSGVKGAGADTETSSLVPGGEEGGDVLGVTEEKAVIPDRLRRWSPKIHLSVRYETLEKARGRR